MKKIFCIILTFCMAVTLAACGEKKPNDKNTGFKPALDTQTSCNITVVGSYDNFEALELEFTRFNEIYPNVELSYVKLDDYNNVLATVLESNEKPNIFFSHAWMIGNEKYAAVVANMEELSDASLGLDLNCIRPGLINHDEQGRVLLVPVFSRTYGMLVNNDLFKKEGVSIPTKWSDLLTACQQLHDKGYSSPMMGYSRKSSSCFMNTVAYPMFVASLANNPEALKLANDLNPAAGEYMRPALEAVMQLIKSGCFNLEECNKIEDNYSKVIMRFLEGDVPMMVCTGDTVSGTKKRERQSENFAASPFEYSFLPIPLTEEGGYFIDSTSLELSVNKNCNDLDMTNEFMRFLITNTELNEMASVKRMVTPTKDLSFDSVYAPFGQIPEALTFSPEVIGIKDPLTVQIRNASFRVGTGELTVDQAIAMYGSLE